MVESDDRGPEAEPKARVFISYSRKDMAFADNLEAALKARGFEPLIIAPRSMRLRTGGGAFRTSSSRLTMLFSCSVLMQYRARFVARKSPSRHHSTNVLHPSFVARLMLRKCRVNFRD
jgi:hypothetical protein